MPSNIEIKAVLMNRVAAERVAARLSGSEPQTFSHEDFFFACEEARLKLRVFAPDRGELIRYERVDRAETRRSTYAIARTPDPANLLDILTTTLGRIGVVRKIRTLYLIGQTRVHLDRVEGLGEFLELEVVLQPGQSEPEGQRIAAELLAEFGIGQEQMIAEAYVDLLRQRECSPMQA